MSTTSKQRKQQHHQERISVHKVMKDINYMFNKTKTVPAVQGHELLQAGKLASPELKELKQ